MAKYIPLVSTTINIPNYGGGSTAAGGTSGQASDVSGFPAPDGNPVAEFKYIVTKRSIVLQNKSKAFKSNLKSYEWDFGDGNTSTDKDTYHTYDNDGWYTVTLKVTDSKGRESEIAESKVYIAAEGVPVSRFNVALVDAEITLTDNSVDYDGTIVSWSWDFGDGNTSTQQNPTHTYSENGDYNITLTVTDDSGEVMTSKPTMVSVVSIGSYMGEIWNTIELYDDIELTTEL